MARPNETRGQDSPIRTILSGLRRLFGAERITGTLVPSVGLAIALSVTPTALLLFNNRHAVAQATPFYRAMAATAVIAALAVLFLSRRIAPHVAGGLVAALGYGFYSLSWVPGSNQLPSLTFLWLLISLPGAVVVVWLLSNSRLIVTLAGTAAVAVASWLVFSPLLSSNGPATTAAPSPPEAIALAGEPIRTPNVYLFVMDGFANPDVTTEQFSEHGVSFSIADSIALLEAQGFRHDEDATSNYGQTILSLPSTLNGAYAHTPETPLTKAEVWDIGIASIRGNNTLGNTLRAAGYEYWSASSGAWDPSRCDPRLVDRCLDADAGNAEAKKAVWWHTPLRWQLAITDFRELPDPASVVESIIEARSTHDTDTPYLAVAHIIAPHQPYRYEADCSFRDGSAPGTTLEDGSRPEFRQLYADQAACVGEFLVEAMDDLIEADPDAMIFLQSDHGSDFESSGFPTESADWSTNYAEERLGVFRATRIPEECRSTDSRSQSVINTMPTILSCVFGTGPELIDPRYFTTDRSGNFAEVEEISSPLSE